MTATWRKQPPIPSRQNFAVRNQPRFIKARLCRKCDTEIEQPLKYCWKHWSQLTDLEKDNARTLKHG